MTPLAIRSGPGYWLASLRVMMRFEYGKIRQWAAIMVVIQTMMGAGMAMMYGFFYPVITPARALYITTGAPALALIPLGFVILPGVIAAEKSEGTFDYIWSLPTPRTAQAAAAFGVYSLITLPGTALALLVAAWRYHVHLSVSPILVPGAALCALVAIVVGYGMALAISSPLVTNLITNALVFVVLMFSPIVYPASQLPGWLYSLHEALPFYNMAVVIRAGLTTGMVSHTGTSFLVLAGWGMAGCVVTTWLVSRRQ